MTSPPQVTVITAGQVVTVDGGTRYEVVLAVPGLQGPPGPQGIQGPPAGPAVVTLADAPIILVDASQGTHFRVTLGGNRTLGAPSHLTDGQKFTVEVTQDATGGRTLAYATGPGGYAWGTDVPAPALTVTPGKRDFLGFLYDATTNLCYGVAFIRGF